MKKNTGTLFTIFTISICLFCNIQVSQAKPSDKDLSNLLEESIGSAWSVIDFHVHASQNYGTEVEPLWKYRFTSTVRLNVPLYSAQSSNNEYNVTFLSESGKKGTNENLHGIASARIHLGKWEVRWNFDAYPLGDYGNSLEDFKGQTVIVGSDEQLKISDEIAKNEEKKRIAYEEVKRKKELARQEEKRQRQLMQEVRDRQEKFNKMIGSETPIDVVIFQELIDQGVDLGFDGVGFQEITPLMRAARWGQVDAVRLLLKAGVDVNAHKQGFTKDTALYHAKNSPPHPNKAEIIKILRDAGGKYPNEL